MENISVCKKNKKKIKNKKATFARLHKTCPSFKSSVLHAQPLPLRVTCGFSPELQHTNTSRSWCTASEDPVWFIFNRECWGSKKSAVPVPWLPAQTQQGRCHPCTAQHGSPEPCTQPETGSTPAWDASEPRTRLLLNFPAKPPAPSVLNHSPSIRSHYKAPVSPTSMRLHMTRLPAQLSSDPKNQYCSNPRIRGQWGL